MTMPPVFFCHAALRSVSFVRCSSSARACLAGWCLLRSSSTPSMVSRSVVIGSDLMVPLSLPANPLGATSKLWSARFGRSAWPAPLVLLSAAAAPTQDAVPRVALLSDWRKAIQHEPEAALLALQLENAFVIQTLGN